MRIYSRTLSPDPYTGSKWFRNGLLHRDNDLPARSSRGNYAWFQDGKLHREGGPAHCTTHTSYWYRHGKIVKMQPIDNY